MTTISVAQYFIALEEIQQIYCQKAVEKSFSIYGVYAQALRIKDQHTLILPFHLYNL